MRRWLVLASLALSVQAACAATLFVNATTGDDKNPGTSADEPLKSISRAAQVSRPGDTVLVAPGTYAEQVAIGLSGKDKDAAERTVFRAEPLGKAILDGEEKQFRFTVRRPKVSLVGFECRRSREHAIDFGEGADGGLVDACTLVDNKLDGVFFRKCKGGRVERTVCARNGRHGIWFLEADGGAAVNDTLFGNRGAGLSIDRTPGVVAFNNLVADNGVGIRLHNVGRLSETATLRREAAEENPPRSGGPREETAGFQSDHNLLSGGFLGQVHGPQWLFGASAGTLVDWQALSGQDAHSICGDPMLADPDAGDFAPLAPPRGNRSPALRPDLPVATFAGIEAPKSDIAGRTVGAGLVPAQGTPTRGAPTALGAVWLDGEVFSAQGKPFASLEMPFDGQLSVGIFDQEGHLVCTLLTGYPAAKGRLDLYWDGQDALRRDAPPGPYQWRAVALFANRVRGVDDGSVGDTGQPPYGKTQVSDAVCDLAVDAKGDLYEMSFWDEAGHCLRKLKADGTADWVIPFYIRNTAGGLGTAVATDGRYVFGALVHQRDGKGGRIVRDDVRRLDAATGAPANFPAAEPTVGAGLVPAQGDAHKGRPYGAAGQKPDNLIQVNPEKPEIWIHAQRHSPEQARRLFAIRGLALDATRLFVSNHYRDRIEVYDKETGAKLSEFSVPKPLGIAVAPDGQDRLGEAGHRAVGRDATLWVANSGDRVSQFTLDGQRKAEIAGLADPYPVTFGGPDNHLYLAEMGAGQIREYAVGAGLVPAQGDAHKGRPYDVPRLIRTLGRAAKGPGPVQPDVFRFGEYCGLAVDAQGRISVTDQGNHRVQRFHPDGSLWQSLYSDFVSAPFVDLREPDVLLSGTRQYRVDYATGRWAFTHNWQPADGKFATDMVLRRKLPNGRDYLFHLGGHRLGVVVYAVEGDTARRSAMLGGRWMGTDDLGAGGPVGMYFWRDADGDGQVADSEMTWTQQPGKGFAYSALAPGWWADERGDLWLADQVTRSILRLRLQGFDERANPLYDWAKRETVVPRDESPWKFVPTNLRVAEAAQSGPPRRGGLRRPAAALFVNSAPAVRSTEGGGPDGDLYVQGTIEGRRDMGPFWMGGTAVARFAPDGARRWVLPLPRVAVATATDGDFWYAAEGPTAKVSMYTDDGLFLCAMAPGGPSGYQSGWIDHAMGLFAFLHPGTKAHYVYAEEDLFGKSIRYRIEGLETLRRLEGTFAWPL